MRAILIRHGKTVGNLEGRYIGSRTDEPLCGAGREALASIAAPAADCVISSPMRRCIETAAILYPGREPVIINGLRECDFGAFEGMNYAELNGRADYQAWIDSGGELPFPGGESRAQVEERTAAAFEQLRMEHAGETVAVIAHGGTLMSVMARFAAPQRDYFSYQVRNGEGFVLEADGSWRRFPSSGEDDH